MHLYITDKISICINIIDRVNFLIRTIFTNYRSDSAQTQMNRTLTAGPVTPPNIFDNTYCKTDKDCCIQCNGTCNGRHL